ncbi:MAG TPA: MFS transporter, partial [Thermoanaerobaculia bacterium]|nr:MFS transporter [Thermoanaerobaculia bacterium]
MRGARADIEPTDAAAADSPAAPAGAGAAAGADAGAGPSAGAPAAPLSAWSPLRHRLFRWLWIATVASNVGTWLQNVGASWMMTSLTTSTTLVALV